MTRPSFGREGLGLAYLALAVLLAAPLIAYSEILPSNPPYPGTLPLKEANSDTVAPGGSFLWTITIYNDYFKDPAVIYISDDVPDPADSLPVPAFNATLGGDIVSLPPGATFTYTGDILSISNINIDGRSSEKVVLRTRVLASAPEGTVICNRAFVRHVLDTCGGSPPLCTTVTYDSGSTPAAKTCVTVQTPKPVELKAVSSATTAADSCPPDSTFPPPDGTLSPGEYVDLTLAVHNTGSTDATATPVPITGTLSPGTGYTIVSGSSPISTTVVANTLQANAANLGTNSTRLTIRVDPRAACPSTLTVPLVVSNVKNGPFTINYTFQVGAGAAGCQPRCLDAPLAPGTQAVRDLCGFTPPGNNGKVDPGDDVNLFLPVRNIGTDDLRGAPSITGTLTTSTAGVNVLVASSTYPDILAGGSATNATEYSLHVDNSVACGTTINLRLSLTGSEGLARSLDLTLPVASPCTICRNACAIAATAAATGPTRLCPGTGGMMDAGTSTVTGCTGGPVYQWFEGLTPIPGANAVTWAIPATLSPGNYSYEVEVSCLSQPTCVSRSAPVSVSVDPLPLGLARLVARKVGADIAFSWTLEPTATGGYHGYRTTLKTEIPFARLNSTKPNVRPAFSTAPDPSVNNATVANDVPGPPANPALFFYQAVASCSDGLLEGPN